MNKDYSHLKPSAQNFLDLSQEERIYKVRSPRWIGYPKAKIVLKELDKLMRMPKIHRMPNLLLIGDTNNGKTMLIKRFEKLNPSSDNVNGEGINIPVMVIQAPPKPDESRLYNIILDSLFAHYKQNDRVDKKLFQVIHLLKYIGLKVLIIDEIHHLLAGSLEKQRGFLNVIKYLGNELQIPIVGVGTEAAKRSIATDPQLSNRFKPVELPLWKNDEEFLRLLASFEQMLPLKRPSNLTSEDLANRLYFLSEGYLGEISQLLVELAVIAIETGHEKIELNMLKEINWVPPSRRR
ncbi:TniB family NTP-binding protein [Acinetobacter baumannii]|uniref:TniB family NTP-binding protein n=1 Tax=Acinetobacter baumannii TaxID=470 RepID=UPI001C0C267A|nr:TniB family NTP-binding protein [Acinetobacter baumannii]MBU3082500.1 TniB family NTP-binding protein [Acinetobacter baumannii]MDC4652067.1 TniB family NTP-binding protein [Acinetobacter baumannii]MDC5116116.1 TniB family NTP-binding protein [Acinetobacter baumannii]